MPRIQCLDVKKGTTVEREVTEKVWKRIVKVPSVFGANKKYKLVPQITPGAIPQFDTGAKHPKPEPPKVNDDLGEDTKVLYGDEAYKYDLEQGKNLFKSGKYKESLEFFERALKFKPNNPYIKGQINKIHDQSTAN